MADPVRVEITGIAKLLLNLHNIGKDIKFELARAYIKEGEDLMFESKPLVPLDLGTLVSSGFVRHRIEGETVTVEAGYGGAAEKYAIYVHEGTGPAVGHAPYFPPRQALETWAKSHGFDDVAAVQWAIYRHGTKPIKYLEGPFNRRAPGAIDRVGKALAARLR